MRRYLLIDLEATCDDQGKVPRDEMEIIEIGALLVEPDTWAVKEEFCTFVRPVRHAKLTPFCTKLTSITQEHVETASGYVEVMKLFRHWLRPFRLTAWGSWGNYDRRQIEQDCTYHQLPFPIQTQHFNLKDRFAKRHQLPQRPGLAKAVEIAGLKFIGVHHRGIDDTRNIAQLMPFLYGDKKLPIAT